MPPNEWPGTAQTSAYVPGAPATNVKYCVPDRMPVTGLGVVGLGNASGNPFGRCRTVEVPCVIDTLCGLSTLRFLKVTLTAQPCGIEMLIPPRLNPLKF